MLCKRIFSVAALISSTLAAPSPQEFDPNDQVEVVGPVSTNDPEYDYGDDYGGFFGGGFPSIFGAPRVRVLVVPVDEAGLDGGVGGIGDFLSSIFGPTRELAPTSESEQPSEDCEVMCTFIKELFEGHLKGVRDHIDDVRDRENEIGGDYDFGGDSDNGFDVNNSTHTTKVLEDGSVVHINKTTISDTDEDGNSFFFHKSVIHTVSDGQDGEDEAGTLQPETGASQADDSNGDLIEEDKNLVEEDKAGEVQADGVDDGLMQ